MIDDSFGSSVRMYLANTVQLLPYVISLVVRSPLLHGIVLLVRTPRLLFT